MENQGYREMKAVELQEQNFDTTELIKKVEDTPFTLVENEMGVMIAVGNQIASEKIFKTKDDAKEFIESKPYYLIMIATAIYIQQLNKKENE